MKRSALILVGVKMTARELKRTVLNIMISVLIFTMFLAITSLYSTLQEAKDNQLMDASQEGNVRELTLIGDKSVFADDEALETSIEESLGQDNGVESMEVQEEDESSIELLLTLSDYRDNLKIMEKLDPVQGINVVIDTKTYDALNKLSIVDKAVTIMMGFNILVLFILVLMSQSHQISENTYEFAQMKAFGYTWSHLAIISGTKSVLMNGLSFFLAMLVSYSLLGIDVSAYQQFDYAVHIQRLSPIGLAESLAIILFLTMMALILNLRKMGRIEPMFLLKEME